MANPGLSIKLIHRDSQPNLTQSHRTQKLILLSKARAMRLTKDLHSKYINNSNANVVPAKIYYQKDSTYMAQVSIGTFRRTPPISYFLDVDTGSGIIWIQCQECRNPGHHCFYQRQPLSPLWNPFLIKNLCIGNFCSYLVQYDDGATSEGYLASETFNFDSNSTSRNVVFGYGINQIKMDRYGTGGGNVAGILGLGWSSHSLVNQLGPIAQANIAGSRLTIPANYFQRRSGRGGTIIDTGTAHTFLVRPAYEMLERALVNYFSRMPSVFRIHRQRFFNLCYQRTTTRGGFNNLPTIAFHLSNADLVVQPQGAFYLGDIFGRYMIGAYQQTNQRFIYDVSRKTLNFGPADCARNP
ncbi:hypothetical protein PRUPE_3G234600 [Prunus persica]|uniref:Peptidase A1 domain-containing protein n=1 Tax=Prunus persica TaxID=3760 RepID=A0A251Q7S8_PRUPE|nr:hypothetical protein PRUPE_3G234600 [Prunus persica]